VARKALADQPDEPRLLFNLACFESLGGRHEEAIAHLRRAVELDPSFAAYARKDTDFDPIRDDPAFPA
jgi:tetratricopeptide (TPR) repeat protein